MVMPLHRHTGFRPLQRTYFSPILPMPKAAELLLAVLTVASAVFSVWLVNAAVRRLGKQWAVAARLVEGHKLITDGPYGLVRNNKQRLRRSLLSGLPPST